MKKVEGDRWDSGLVRYLITVAQSDSTIAGLGDQSVARVRPSLHSNASTCSDEPPPSIYFPADSITCPKWFLIITPMPASPEASEKAPSTLIFIQPISGAFQEHFAGA